MPLGFSSDLHPIGFGQGGRFNIADWQTEIGVVQHVEKLATKLKFFRFRQSNVFEREKSQFTYPGPWTALRPSSPNCSRENSDPGLFSGTRLR